jgi:hypothetical protein
MTETMMDDGLYAAVLGHEDDARTIGPRRRKAPKEYVVSLIHAGKLGVTYRVDVGAVKGTTVKATRFQTLCCLTCLTVDRCIHVAAVREHIAEHGTHEGTIDGRDRAPLPSVA